jgi:HSP90 family molecular chaperone
MAEELRFTADAALIDRLGRELVGKQETALIELVKNSYDADAEYVKVTLTNNVLVIDDNGVGMARDELIDGFLRLASDMKVRHPLSQKYKRHRAGRKGIGRFSTQRLGSSLRLRTWKAEVSRGSN